MLRTAEAHGWGMCSLSSCSFSVYEERVRQDVFLIEIELYCGLPGFRSVHIGL